MNQGNSQKNRQKFNCKIIFEISIEIKLAKKKHEIESQKIHEKQQRKAVKNNHKLQLFSFCIIFWLG
jgi:hypothetical protein